MITLITQRNKKITKLENVDILENNYVKYYEQLGLTLVPIPNVTKDVSKYFDIIGTEAIILSGGAEKDIRENIEMQLIFNSMSKGIPLLGICRGAQMINKFFNGGLVNVKNHVRKNHTISIVDKKIAKDLNVTKEVVNSYHDEGINKESLSSVLKPFAICKRDNTIEGLYHPDHPIAGIMWHPERDQEIMMNKQLISALIHRNIFWSK